MVKSCSSSYSEKNNGLKKGPWTPEEDQKLMDYIQKHGYGKWRTLPKNAGLKRCGKSCRLRWANYLRPDIKRGRFSLEEEETIIQLHSVLGNKWSTIAANLPGRTDNEIKNYWNTHVKKKLLKMGIDPVTHTLRLDVLQLSSILSSSFCNNNNNNNYSALMGSMASNPSQVLNLLTTLFSCQSRINHDAAVLNQNFHQNYQIGSDPLLQNQFQCSQQMYFNTNQYFQSKNQPQVSIQEPPHQPCSASNDPNMNLEQHSHHMKSKCDHQMMSQIATNNPFSHQNSLPTLWHYNGSSSSSAMQNFPSPKFKSNILNSILENEILCNNEGFLSSNFNLSSLLLSSTSSSSSSSNLNSSSSTTFINGTTHEDERDSSYGSNMLIYNNISNGLSSSGLL